MRRERVDLSALAAEIAEQLAEHEPARPVACAIQPNLVALGDGSLLRVVLENLLGNAWKYTGRRERPEVAFRSADGSADELPEHAELMHAFCVSDNGVGFDMAYADKLFSPFQRLHTESDFPGTGIGLATVQRIIQRHGGRVWARSAPGRGASFYFTLP
jgi:signal transduction histidine kinase